MLRLRQMFCAGLTFAAFLTLAAHGGSAQTVEEFYKGRQVVLINGNTPGDRGDIVARLVTKHLSQHIPGKPTIVSQNMPAAGTLVAANYLYNVAPRDGSVFGNFSRSIPVQSLMGQASTNYEPRRFGWIGSPELTEQICVANAAAAVKTAQDIFSHELIIGGSGPTTVTQYLPLVLNNVLGARFNIVGGYKGATDIFLAMDRGELEGACTVLNNINGERPDWIAGGQVRILFHTATQPSRALREIPSIYDFVKTEEQKQIIFLVNSGVEFGRPFVTPPGVPEDRLRAFRVAFVAMMEDPAFLADAKLIALDVGFTPGERMDAMLERLYATPPELVARSAEMMGFAKK